jgi:AcrR family transcriptional regulator
MDVTPIVAPRTRKARGQGASRRGEILQAAKHLFLEEGVQHVTMRRIAASVGVSATALYVYFPDKDAILKAIAADHFAAMLVVLQQAVRPDRTATENLRTGLRAYIDFALAQPDEYRLTFLRTGRREEPDPCETLPEADMSFDVLLRAVQAMIDAGLFPSTSPMLMAESLWACMHGVVSLLLTMPDKCVSDPVMLTNQVIDMAIAGLRA